MQPLLKTSQRQDWAAFFKINCNALFQTALLLTADPREAEATIAAVIDQIDVSIPPNHNELENLQEQLARWAVQNSKQAAASQIAEAGSLLQIGLRPILQIDRRPRICFVLRMLLGNTTSTCARDLGVEESMVKNFLRIAILQLQNTVGANGYRQSPFQYACDQSSDSHSLEASTRIRLALGLVQTSND